MGNATTIDIIGRNDKLKKSVDETKNILQGFSSIVKSAAAATAALFVVDKIFDFGKNLVTNAAEAQLATAKLNAALEATQHGAGFSTAALKNYADALETVTNFESEATQGAMAVIATFKNIKGDQFTHATKAAQDMATILGGDLSSSAMLLAKALNDPDKALGLLSKSGVTFSDSQKKMIESLMKVGDVAGAQTVILKELDSEFGGAAEAAGKTFIGALGNVADELGNVGDEIGDAIIKVMEDFGVTTEYIIAYLKAITPAIVETIAGFAQMGKEIVAYLQPTFEWLIDAGVTCFTAVEFAINHFWEIAEYVFSSFELAIIKTFSTFQHWLLSEVPEALTWFADNFGKIFYDIGAFVGTVFTNMAENIWDFFEAVANLLSGGEFNFEFTALTEGFQSSIDKLPELTKRIPGEIEKALEGKLDALGEQLGDDFGEAFNKNKKAMADMFVLPVKMKVEVPKEDVKKTAYTDNEDDKDKKKDKKKADKKEEEKHESTTEDLVSLNKRIQNAAASDPNKKLIDSQESLADDTKELTKEVSKQIEATARLRETLTPKAKTNPIQQAKTSLNSQRELNKKNREAEAVFQRLVRKQKRDESSAKLAAKPRATKASQEASRLAAKSRLEQARLSARVKRDVDSKMMDRRRAEAASNREAAAQRLANNRKVASDKRANPKGGIRDNLKNTEGIKELMKTLSNVGKDIEDTKHKGTDSHNKTLRDPVQMQLSKLIAATVKMMEQSASANEKKIRATKESTEATKEVTKKIADIGLVK